MRLNFIYKILPMKDVGVMLQARGFLRKKTHVSGNEYYYIHIPAKLARDSQFPFKDGDELRIAVDTFRNRMIVEKVGVSREGRKRNRKKRTSA